MPSTSPRIPGVTPSVVVPRSPSTSRRMPRSMPTPTSSGRWPSTTLSSLLIPFTFAPRPSKWWTLRTRRRRLRIRRRKPPKKERRRTRKKRPVMMRRMTTPTLKCQRGTKKRPRRNPRSRRRSLRTRGKSSIPTRPSGPVPRTKLPTTTTRDSGRSSTSRRWRMRRLGLTSTPRVISISSLWFICPAKSPRSLCRAIWTSTPAG
mmetsp:Transcript_36835/g.80233  ORF Transcript_36835/g.80233 Transcript_36835/m.80233 type:complete len:204 (-) Transcript_36835:842-1453(-)